MAQREVRILLNTLNDNHTSVLCIRLETDRCEINGHLVSASKVANRLDVPIPVEAVITEHDKFTRIGDVLVLRDPRGTEIGRKTVTSIDLSHTDLLTEDDRRSCVAEALEHPADHWALIFSSGPIWCFHFSETVPPDSHVDL